MNYISYLSLLSPSSWNIGTIQLYPPFRIIIISIEINNTREKRLKKKIH